MRIGSSRGGSLFFPSKYRILINSNAAAIGRLPAQTKMSYIWDIIHNTVVGLTRAQGMFTQEWSATTKRAVLAKAAAEAVGGGLSGGFAMVLQIALFMWLRTSWSGSLSSVSLLFYLLCRIFNMRCSHKLSGMVNLYFCSATSS